MMLCTTSAIDREVSGLSEVIDLYDCILVDVWGVLIDGSRPFPEAVACLGHLSRLGLPTILVSNTSRRSTGLQSMLSGIGILPNLYSGTVTAGDVAFDLVQRRHIGLGGARRCLVIGDQPGGHWADAAGVEIVATPREADFVLAVGILSPGWRQGATAALIDQALGIGLPFLVTNPDRKVSIDGIAYDGVGLLTDMLSPLGANVIETGKPHPGIFAAARDRAARLLGRAVRSAVMVGDSIETDIRGAARFGIDSMLIGAWSDDSEPIGDRYESTVRESPTWRLGGFKW